MIHAGMPASNLSHEHSQCVSSNHWNHVLASLVQEHSLFCKRLQRYIAVYRSFSCTVDTYTYKITSRTHYAFTCVLLSFYPFSVSCAVTSFSPISHLAPSSPIRSDAWFPTSHSLAQCPSLERHHTGSRDGGRAIYAEHFR